jgi:hypothetical protein
MSRPGNFDTATSTGPASNPAAVSAPRPHDRRDSWPRTGSDAASPLRSSGWLLVICAVCLAILLARRAALLSAAGVCMVQPRETPPRGQRVEWRRVALRVR